MFYLYLCFCFLLTLQKAKEPTASSRERTGASRSSSGEISCWMKLTDFFLMTSSLCSVRYGIMYRFMYTKCFAVIMSLLQTNDSFV